MSDPVGQIVDLPAIGFDTPTVAQPMTIVGIVKQRARAERSARADVLGIAYVPIAQAPIAVDQAGGAHTRPMPRRSCRRCARRCARSIHRVALADVRTVEQSARAAACRALKEPAWLIGIFAALSALLAALGLYGVVSHSVSQQQREIGIRMALGARSSEVLSMVVRQRADDDRRRTGGRRWRRGRH